MLESISLSEAESS